MASVEHLDGHPHAFIDSNGIVLNVAAFDGHDFELIPIIMQAQPNAVDFVCLCVHGVASIGDIWDGIKFHTKVEG